MAYWPLWVLLAVLAAGIRKLPMSKRFVVFRLGRFVDYRGPGEAYLIPLLESTLRVDVDDSYALQPGARLRIGT